jgi:hypothetical protein
MATAQGPEQSTLTMLRARWRAVTRSRFRIGTRAARRVAHCDHA